MKIRNSAKAILIHEKKLLVATYEDEEGIYHLLPGGGQKIGETLHETLKRECLEEAGIKIEIDDLLFVRECFMDPKVHRVEFMYSCVLSSFKKESNLNSLDLDNKQVGVSWIPVDELLKQPLFPIEMRKLIKEFSEDNKKNTVYLGRLNENMFSEMDLITYY